MSPRSNRKSSTFNFKKTHDLDEIFKWYWSADTLFWQVQLIITWMSNTKEVHSKPRLHVSLSTCYLEYGRHVARLRRRRRRAYAPTSNTASHDNHEKINSWVSFCFPYMGCLWGSSWRPFGPPELRYNKVIIVQKFKPKAKKHAQLSIHDLIELVLTILAVYSTVSILAVTDISVNLVNTRSSI